MSDEDGGRPGFAVSLVRPGLSLFGARVVSVGLGFLALAAFARELSPAELGTFFLFQATVHVGGLVADGGIRGAAEKRISEGEDADATLGTAVALKAVAVAVVGVAVLAARGPLSAFLGADLAVALVATLAVREFASLSTAVLRGELRVETASRVEIGWKVVYVVVGVGAVSAGGGVRAVVYAYLLGQATMLVHGLAHRETGLGTPTVARARSIGRYARYQFSTNLGTAVHEWTDVVVIGLVLAQSAVGRYEVAWRVSAVALLFTQSTAMAAFPQLSEWSGAGATDRVESAVSTLLTASVLVAIPAFFGAVVLSREILGVVFGPGYASAWLVLSVVMVKDLAVAVDAVVGRTLKAIDAPDLASRSVVATVVVNLVLNVALVPAFGTVGAALATSTATLVGTVLGVRYLSAHLAVRFPLRPVAWSVGAAAAMAVAVGTVRTAVGVDAPAELVAVVGLGVAVYAVLVLGSPSVRSLAREMLVAVRGGEADPGI